MSTKMTMGGSVVQKAVTAFLVGVGLLAAPAVSLAATVYVDSTYTVDTPGWNDTAFATIQSAVNNVIDGDIIHVAPGTYTENVTIDVSVSIVGDAGAATTIVDGNKNGRTFTISSEGFDLFVFLEGLTIRNGAVKTVGGGVFVQGFDTGSSATFTSCVIVGNSANTFGGGIVGQTASIYLDNTTVSGNTVTNGSGGGVYVSGGNVNILNSTVSGNTASKNGGGMYRTGTGAATITHATISLNTANATSNGGGGIYLSSGTLALNNSIVAGNTATTSANIFGTINSGSNNIIDGDPKLSTLANNGGPTPTHALLTGSPALNAGLAGATTLDQRGVPRAQGNAPDAGAFEVVYLAYVDDGFTASDCGGHVWGVDAFTSVQAAGDAIAANGTVNVAAGTYAGDVALAKNLTLTGAGATEINGNVTFSAPALTVSGVKLTAGKSWNVSNGAVIQQAVDAASVGDTVNVASGTFAESVNLNKALTLLGANAGVAGNGSRGAESAITFPTGTAMVLAADGAVVKGFKLSGIYGATASGFRGITLQNNLVNADAVGIQLQNIVTDAEKGMSVSNNKVFFGSQLAGSNPTAGIAVGGATGSQAVTILDNVVENAFTGYVLYAVNTTPCTTISGGTISGVMQGVAVLNVNPATGATYLPSTFGVDGVAMSGFAGDHTGLPNNNFHAGVYVFTGGSVGSATVKGLINNVSVTGTGKPGPDSAGLYFGDYSTVSGSTMQEVTVQNCTVANSLNRGLYARGANTKVAVARSTFSANGSDPYGTGGNHGFGVIVRNGASVTVDESSIANPDTVTSPYKVYALSVLDVGSSLTTHKTSLINSVNPSGILASGTMDATRNWWGAASGPAAGMVTAGVSYTPWYTEVGMSNLAPYGIDLTGNSVAENSDAGSFVGTFGTTDADAGDTFTYTFATGAGDADNASFTIDGTTLKTAAVFNFETKSSYTVRIQTDDNKGGVYAKAFTVTVNNVNDAPVANGDTYSVDENGTLTIAASGVLANDTDQDANPLTAVLVTGPAHNSGPFTLNADGSFTYVNNGDESATDSFTYKANDGTADSNVATVSITVTPVNDAPTVASTLPDLNKQQDFATFTIPLAFVFADAENNALGYSVAVTGDDVLSAAVNGTDLTLTSKANARGVATVTVTATETATTELLSVNDVFTVTVKPVWNETQNTVFDAVQPAINAAAAGDIIRVAAGTYPEELTIAKALTVTGSNGAALDGTTLGLQKVGVKIKSGDVTFNNVDVSHFSGNGIIVGYEASIPGSLKNIHITNCKISGIQPGYSHGFGIYVGYESEAFKYVPPRLTAHLDYSGLLIENNEISDSRSSALVLQSITGTPGTLVVRNNYIHDGNNDGIWIDCARNIVIEDNDLVRNMDGIYISSYADTVKTPYTPALNSQYSPMNIQITGNQILDNEVYGGIYLEAGWPSTIVMNQNSFAGNTLGGLLNYLSEEVDAPFNYWGDAGGPAGAGDDVVGSVSYSPFYTEPELSNLAPYDIGLTGVTVAENEAAGKEVGVLSTVDADAGNTFTYELLAGGDSFQLDGSTLKTKVALNHEDTPTITVRVRTSDGHNGVYEKDFAVTVTDVNEAPVLGAIGAQSIGEQSLLSFSVTATDQDGQPLTYSLVGEAYGATITVAGAFSWQPTETQGGKAYDITVQVSDGELTDTRTFEVSVAEVNAAPELQAIANRTSDGLAPVTLQASATDQDDPVQTLTFSLDGETYGASITAGGAFAWQPTEEQDPGTYNFTVKVTDNGTTPDALSASATFTVTVTEDNKAPVAGNDSYTVAENGTLNLAAAGVLANDTDADLPPNTLNAVLVVGPAHSSSFTLNPDGSFTYVNNGDESATDSFTYKANDGTADSNVATVSITVTPVNDAPVVASPLPNLFRQQDFTTETIPLSSVFSDPDSTLAYSVTVDGVVNAAVNGMDLTLTSQAGARGVATVTVTATETGATALSISTTFTVTVKPVWNTTKSTFFDTIQAAVAAATSGDAINAAAGTYAEYITISKALTLQGANAGIHPAVGTCQTETVGVRKSETVISGQLYPQADDIVLDGLKFTKSGGRVVDTYANANRFIMRNCIFANAAAYAEQGVIQFGGGSHIGMVVEFNLFQFGDIAMFYFGGGPYDGLTIRYNKINGSGDSIFWAATPLVDGVIQQNEFDGTINGNPGVGFNTVNIGQAGNLQFVGNYVHDINYTALQVGIIDGVIQDNTFEDIYAYDASYGGYAIYLWGGAWGTAVSESVDISNNTISYNEDTTGPVHGIRLPANSDPNGAFIDASTIAIHDNQFISGSALTTAYAVRHQGDQTTVIDVSSNYWGAGVPFLDAQIQGPYTADTFYADYDLTDLRVWTVYVDDSFTEEDATHFKTIQGGVNAANLYGTVHVAAGIYNEHVTITKTLSLIGADQATTTIDGGGAGVVVMVTANDVEISGFKVTGSGMSGVAGGIGLVNASGCSIVGNTVQGNLMGIGVVGGSGNTVSGNTLTANGIGITLENLAAFGGTVNDGATGNTIVNNMVTGSLQHGINIPENCDNNLIKDNTVTGSAQTGIYLWKADGCTVQNNTVSGGTDGIQVFAAAGNQLTGNTVTGNQNGFNIRTGDVEQSVNTLIANNVISGNSAYGVKADANRGNLVAISGNYWGSPTGPSGVGFFGGGDKVAGSVQIESYYVGMPLTTLHYYNLFADDSYASEDVTHFKTIQAALAATNPGDTVHVLAGVYAGNISITKPLRLIADDGAALTTLTGAGASGAALTIASSNVELRGFTITNPSGLIGVKASEFSNLLIADNVVTGIATAIASATSVPIGIRIQCISAAVDNVVISNNTVNQIVANGTSKSASGVWVGDSTGNFNVTGLVIQDNRISNVTSAGKGAYGILLCHAYIPNGTGSTVAPQILNNVITDLTGGWAHAIGLEGNTPNALVQGNVIARLTDSNSPAAPDATGVMLEANAGASTVTLTGNSFTQTAFGVINATAQAVAAGGNYWGSATGPTGTGLHGTGSAIYGAVTVGNYYADAGLTTLHYYELYVDDDFSNSTEGWGIFRFATVQNAVTAANPYDTVHVAAGLYIEDVKVSKHITLLCSKLFCHRWRNSSPWISNKRDSARHHQYFTAYDSLRLKRGCPKSGCHPRGGFRA